MQIGRKKKFIYDKGTKIYYKTRPYIVWHGVKLSGMAKKQNQQKLWTEEEQDTRTI